MRCVEPRVKVAIIWTREKHIGGICCGLLGLRVICVPVIRHIEVYLILQVTYHLVSWDVSSLVGQITVDYMTFGASDIYYPWDAWKFTWLVEMGCKTLGASNGHWNQLDTRHTPWFVWPTWVIHILAIRHMEIFVPASNKLYGYVHLSWDVSKLARQIMVGHMTFGASGTIHETRGGLHDGAATCCMALIRRLEY
jgi:hypothetical protein